MKQLDKDGDDPSMIVDALGHDDGPVAAEVRDLIDPSIDRQAIGPESQGDPGATG
jgi:hypothetical protein